MWKYVCYLVFYAKLQHSREEKKKGRRGEEDGEERRWLYQDHLQATRHASARLELVLTPQSSQPAFPLAMGQCIRKAKRFCVRFAKAETANKSRTRYLPV